jgi:hypothetical protein
MVKISAKKCQTEKCIKAAMYNFSNQNNLIYCKFHAKTGMINISSGKKCRVKRCTLKPIFGYFSERMQFCEKHAKDDMINLFLENKCDTLDCQKEYDHIPKNKQVLAIKRICKICDNYLENISDYICIGCEKTQNKKEYSVVKHLERVIDTPFLHDTSEMLQGCSKRRPDVFYELLKHCVIVEIDEDQHRSYTETCECARISEIVSGLGSDKALTIIRYNPDTVRNKGKILNFKPLERLDLLVKTVKEEIDRDHEIFNVNIVQLYYNDDYDTYMPIKREIITDKVAI